MAGTAAKPQPARAGFTAGSLYAFVVLGLPAGMLGVAWPALRHDFRQPLASLGELLLASLVGYLAVTSVTGLALRRFGTAALLTASAAAAAFGTGVFAATRSWSVLVLASVLVGAAGGGLDAGLNTAVALTGRTRLMNLIHAAFGVGAALGPLLVTAALAVTSSWRGAYVVLLVLDVCLVGVWLALRNAVAALPRRPPGLTPAAPPGNSRPRLLLSLSLTVFFCYAGIEIAVGSWSASFLRAGPAQLSPALAGLAVFGYWAGLTARHHRRSRCHLGEHRTCGHRGRAGRDRREPRAHLPGPGQPHPGTRRPGCGRQRGGVAARRVGRRRHRLVGPDRSRTPASWLGDLRSGADLAGSGHVRSKSSRGHASRRPAESQES